MANKESSIKKMEKKLYAKQNTLQSGGRKHLSHTQTTTASDWADDVVKPVQEEEPKKKKTMTAFTKLFIAALLFFVLSVGAAFLVFTSGQNGVSYANVGLSIQGPNSVPGGEELSYDVIIVNDNDVDIELTDIIVKYPSGAYEAEEESISLTQEVRSIDVISRGETRTERFEAVFFGTEGEVKDITITYEYRVGGSNAILFKERVYQVQLESSPISLGINAPVESISGSEVEIELEVVSNANKTIDNLSLQIEYPFGFQFSEATPAAKTGTEDLFSIGELAVGEKKVIKVLGTLSGQDDETRVFKYRVGLIDRRTDTIANTLQETESVVTIARPPVTLTAEINQAQKSLHILEPGSQIRIVFNFVNNLATQIQNAELTASITGNGFSPRSVDTDGFYDSNSGEILWQKTDVPILDTFTAGESGNVSARLQAFRPEEINGRVVDPVININYQFAGKTFDFENNEKDATSSGKAVIKIPTDLSLESRVLHSIGPFQNAGSINLISNQASEYTIVWKVSNTSSLAEGVEISGVLPPYVEFKNTTQAEGSVLEYNSLTREIVWSLESLPAGAGYGGVAGSEIAFQVVVTPSITHENSSLILVQNQNMQGFDTFSNTARIYNSIGDMKSDSLKSDPQYIPGAEIVSSEEN